MNLFDATGVILIAVDDKFTLEDKDGIEVNKGSIHRQFLDKYYTDESGHKKKIASLVAARSGATEVSIPIDNKMFVLFSYTSQGSREDYPDEMAYRRGLVEIESSLKKAFTYCKEHFHGEVVHTALIGTGIQADRSEDVWHTISESESESRLNNVAKAVGINIEIIRKPSHL